MQIFTSYFARIQKLPSNIVPVSISLKTSAWFTGVRHPVLAPKASFFSVWKANHDNDEYLRHFDQEVLAPLTVQAVTADLQALVGRKDVALLCYEKPSDFCHRHRVAEWFTKNGIPVAEWGEKTANEENPPCEQVSLFS